MEQGIQRAVHNNDSLHYCNSPGHANATLLILHGELKSFLVDAPDDPLLYAYALRDHYVTWAKRLAAVGTWAMAVLDADSPDIPSEGVH